MLSKILSLQERDLGYHEYTLTNKLGPFYSGHDYQVKIKAFPYSDWIIKNFTIKSGTGMLFEFFLKLKNQDIKNVYSFPPCKIY